MSGEQYLFDGTALGCIALCARCKYAIQLRRMRWNDGDKWHEDDVKYHFRPPITLHTAVPCEDVGAGVGR